jgi:hypothetical protein
MPRRSASVGSAIKLMADKPDFESGASASTPALATCESLAAIGGARIEGRSQVPEFRSEGRDRVRPDPRSVAIGDSPNIRR